MNSKLTQRDREHLARVKSLPCSLCAAPGPSDAHHIEQGKHYTCIPLCKDCHTGRNGIHQEKIMWKLLKMTELDCLNETIKRLLSGS